MAHKLESLFSDTLFSLEHCYNNIDFPMFTVCSTAGYEREMECRRRLIALCAKIAQDYGGESDVKA